MAFPRLTGFFDRSLPAMLVAAAFLLGCSGPEKAPVTAIASPAAPGSAEPHLAQGADGDVVLSWLEPDGDGTALRFSTLVEGEWTPARTVARGDDWFVNWADFPSVTPVSGDLWAAHWLVKKPGGTYSYDVAVALSTDRGATWRDPITPHTDDVRTEHGFVTLFPWQSGVGALWLDGRNMVGDGHDMGAENHDMAEQPDSASAGMTLRSAVITADQQLTDPQLLDELVCDCCQTDVALGPDGPIAVYRDRTSDEIRDIYVARAVDGRWQTSQPVADDGWEIAGCPVNGPAIVASGADVAVAWFTGANDTTRVKMARSSDGGATFSAPVDIDAHKPVGRVDIELLDDGTAVVSWLRTSVDGHGEICTQTISTAGLPGDIQVIAQTTTARLSGFPQMLRDGDYLVFAWTDTSADQTSVNTARAAIASLAVARH